MIAFPRVVLVGFMGSGKTAVAKALAKVFRGQMADLDDAIEKPAGQSIHALIGEKGEAKFREIESEVLHDVLKENAADVIALGGGAWLSRQNRELITQAGCRSVWLDAPFELCWQRIISDDQRSRPLAGDRSHAEKLYDERRPVYALANLRIKCHAKRNVSRIAREIVKQSQTWQPLI